MFTHHKETDDQKMKPCIRGEKCGTITVSIYKETNSGIPIFHVESDNEEVLPVSYVIEDVLSVY